MQQTNVTNNGKTIKVYVQPTSILDSHLYFNWNYNLNDQLKYKLFKPIYINFSNGISLCDNYLHDY